MGSKELELVTEAFASNWIAPLGPHVDAFEREFAAAVGSPHAAALSSGTAALHLALRLVGVGASDEVFCSTLTFSATVNPILYERGLPVFIDSERTSWNMDPALLADALADRAAKGRLPRAVVLVHLYGQAANIDPIARTCAQYGVPLIEDAAEALGAEYHRLDSHGARSVVSPGTVGRLGIFSFNGNKIITTSGGGMLVSSEVALIEKARFWATQSRDPAPHYQHSEIGYNYRLSNVLAGIGRGQLRVLAERVTARRRNCAYYQSAFADLPGIEIMPEAGWGKSTRWLTCILVDPKRVRVTREDLRLALAAENIEARPVWKPMHLQPVFAHCPRIGGGVAEDLFERGLCLPSGSNLRLEDIDRVIAVIRGVCGK